MVDENDIEQLYDKEEGTFLADRFVRGTCPNCKAPDQPGDNCGNCDETYSPTELIDPVSTLSGIDPGTAPGHATSSSRSNNSTSSSPSGRSRGTLPEESANYLKNYFLNEPLHDWDISRPAPYFGFEIPDSPGNYWYVWFDAPIGYIGRHPRVVRRQWRRLRLLVEVATRSRSTTSSARTSSTSTPSSGQPC